MSDEAHIDGVAWVAMMAAAAETIAEHEADLNTLDTIVGDGDHGTNFAAALAKAAAVTAQLTDPTPAAVLDAVGNTLVEEMGGAAGVVFGAFFRGAAHGAREDTATDTAQYAAMLQAGLQQAQKWGKAAPGEKTMVDALTAAVAAADAAAVRQQPLPATMQAVAEAAFRGAERTAGMEARKGRARFLGQRSIGFQDAGATSIAFILAAWSETVAVDEMDI